MVRTSQETAQLMKAMATAQGQFGAAIKNAANPAFRSKYADLSAVIDATLEHLNAAGVVVMQHPALDYKENVAFVTVTTRLQLGGEWMESDMAIPAVMRDRFDAQSVGSAITYGCRYALQSILVVPREDDDGNQAAGRGSSEAAQEVGKAKVAALKAKQAEKGPDQLCCYPAGDAYEVTGMPDVMNAHKELLIAYGKITSKQPPIVTMSAEGLDAFKHEFQDNRGGTIVSLKGRKVAEAATALAEANSGKY